MNDLKTSKNNYFQVEYFIHGITRKGYGKVSDCERFMTLVFHDHKDKWQITKEVISQELFKRAKPIEKEIFHKIVNQNLANL